MADAMTETLARTLALLKELLGPEPTIRIDDGAEIPISQAAMLVPCGWIDRYTATFEQCGLSLGGLTGIPVHEMEHLQRPMLVHVGVLRNIPPAEG